MVKSTYFTKVKNSRIIPTEGEHMANKKFNIETYLILQTESNSSFEDKHRYIKIEDINYTRFAKETGQSVNTLKRNIDLLKTLGVVKQTKDGLYYKIKNEFEYYVLFDERFIRKLLSHCRKNLVKVYLIYYKYSMNYGSSQITQDDVLKEIGLSSSSKKNKAMLKEINDILVSLGLIDVEKFVRNGKTILKITAPPYTETKFFRDIGTKVEYNL